jgi:hypothetical protein
MAKSRWILKLSPVLVVVALAVPSSAFGQATRTWVSGVGDDANPCSRTAPCKTFAGAISKTANGGEINCLDPGGFGGVTIGKSLTIKCHYTEGGVLVSGTNAIVINATATDNVTLRGLDINGIGVGGFTSLTGVKVLSAARVTLIDNEIYRFQSGVTIAPTSPSTRVVLSGNHIHNNGIGVINAPGNNTITNTVATLRYNLIHDNTCGVVSGAGGTNGSTPAAATNCGTAAIGAIDKLAATRLWHNGIHDNAFGVFSRGTNSIVDIGHNEVTGNTSFGLRRLEGGQMRTTLTPTNILSNAADDAPTAALTVARLRRAR